MNSESGYACTGQKSAVGPIDGMIPSFYEGELAGSVLHDGRPVSELPLYAIAERAGTVFQNLRSMTGECYTAEKPKARAP